MAPDSVKSLLFAEFACASALIAMGAVLGRVVGYALIQPRLDARLKIVDACGVHNLHGMPGLLGGLTAALGMPGIAKAQLVGIGFTGGLPHQTGGS